MDPVFGNIFAALINVGAVGIIGYLSYRNSKQATKIAQKQAEVAANQIKSEQDWRQRTFGYEYGKDLQKFLEEYWTQARKIQKRTKT